MNPNDPNDPMYQGQALQGQPQAPQSPLNGFHLLQGLGNLAAGLGYLFSGSKADDDQEGDAEEAPRRFRPLRFRGANGAKRVGSKPCCRRPVGGK